MTDIAALPAGAGTPAASAGAGLASPAAAAERAALAKAAKAFEAIFTRQLLGSMRQAGLGEDIAGGSGVEQFRELADARLADGLAADGGLGIAELILKQLDRTP
jgi:flagellar protein FlgJ